jgi:hypothetical protein
MQTSSIHRLQQFTLMFFVGTVVQLLCSSFILRSSITSGRSRLSQFDSVALHSTTSPVSGSTSSSSSGSTSTSDVDLCELAREFVYKKSGFYSLGDESSFSDDFVFRGPIVGPLNKEDYFKVMNTFQIYKAIPDINPNTFGYSIDPNDPNRVWFFVRNTGTFTGEQGLQLGYGLSIPPNGKSIDGGIETFSIMFDEHKKVKHVTVGYVADRFEGNTGGLGAVFGIAHAVGLPIPKGIVLRTLQFIASEILNSDAKTYSTKNIPSWWKSDLKAGDGM